MSIIKYFNFCQGLRYERNFSNFSGVGGALPPQSTSLSLAWEIAYVYLLDEMKREAGGGDNVDSHSVNSANPYAAFGWHADNHAHNRGDDLRLCAHGVLCFASWVAAPILYRLCGRHVRRY